MNGRTLLFLLVIFLTFEVPSVQAETLEIFPTDDYMMQLYEVDGQTVWSEARNFGGEITREPWSENVGNEQGRLTVRSDDAVGYYRIYRASMQFDVSNLDFNNVDSVTLHMSGVNSNLSADSSIVITSHERENEVVQSKQDWHIQNYGTQVFSEGMLQPNNVMTAFEFSQEGIDYLKLDGDGVVDLGVLTYYDFYDIEPSAVYTAGATWRSVESSEKRPYLEIVYSDPEDEYPLYTQIESPNPSNEETAEWADDIYAGGGYECGDTIAECGCAITSLVMMARAHGVISGVTNEDVNPATLNSWLLHNNGYNFAGAIKWSKALDFFGKEIDGVIETPFVLLTHNETALNKIQEAVEAGFGLIGFSDAVRNGHYFAISDYINGEYYIRDPWYYNTVTLNDVADTGNKVFGYGGVLDKANIVAVKEGEVLSGFFEIILASPAELRITDEAGRVTGYKREGNVFEVPTGSYDPKEYIGNPAGAETTAEPHYTKRMMVLQAAGEYLLEVEGTGVGEYNLSVSLRDRVGGSYDYEFIADTELGQIDRYQIDVETGVVTKITEEDDDEDDAEFTCAGFVDLVEETMQHERRITERFFIRQSERICDAVEDGETKMALLRLRVFEVLLRAKKVQNEELETAVDILREQLRNGGGRHKERYEKEGKRKGEKQ